MSNKLTDEEKLDIRGLLCTDWRRLLFWLVVILFSIITLKNLFDITTEYLENPKKADMDVVLNQTMKMPPMTFCFPSGHVLSNIAAGLKDTKAMPDPALLENFNFSSRLVANPWTDELVYSAFNALAAFHTHEVENFEDEVAEKLRAFGHDDKFKFGTAADWKNIRFWQDFMKTNNVSVDDLIQAVGMRAMMKGITRFERETHKPQPPNGRTTVPAKMHIEWLSFRDFCFRPTFAEELPIESQGTFFAMTFKFNREFVVDEDAEDIVPEDECVYIDFHGSRFDREPYMLEGTQKRNGFTEPLCFGSRYEVQVEVRHEYQMIETEDDGVACKDYEDDDEDDYTCRSRCRYNHIKELCKCIPISLNDLTEKDPVEEDKSLPSCDYKKCNISPKNDSYDEIECTKQCVRDCQQTHYSLKTYQRGRVVSLSPQGKPSVADNVLSVAIQYGSFEYLTVEQKYAYTFASFVGDFGGALGMWLGLSILSVIQGITFMTTTATKTFTDKMGLKRKDSPVPQQPEAREKVNAMPIS